MRTRYIAALIVIAVSPLMLSAQEADGGGDFASASESIHRKLEASLAELSKLREQVAAEKVPLSRKLSELESELVNVRLEYQNAARLLDSHTLDLSNLGNEIKSRQQEAAYLSNLLGEYTRNFESRLHIVELQRYRRPLETARLASDNSSLSEHEIHEAQAGLLGVSLDRLFDALGGASFDGTATDSTGSIHHGTFVVMGPAAIFQSDDGLNVGVAEQRLGSLEPTVIPFRNPADAEAAAKVVSGLSGHFPLDPTGGNAHKIEETRETLLEHIKKGGPVMYPIFVLAGAAFLVAVFKWLSLMFVRKPSRKRISALLAAIAVHDGAAAQKEVKVIRGPVGKMLAAGVEHLNEPRELIEEVMYEQVLATRLKLERFLPFIAISAASAPLLGLLGTVTGIINTFKLITVFGSGDVKMLSGGISEALITTEYGLIVAIPSLLLHAFLSRKAKGVVSEMEKAAVAFINQVSKTPFYREAGTGNPGLSASQMAEIVRSLSNQMKPQAGGGRESAAEPGEVVMNTRVLSIDSSLSVSDAVDRIRSAGHAAEGVFVVDTGGKYLGHLSMGELLTQPANMRLGNIVERDALFVRLDTHGDQVRELLRKHELRRVPVLDHNDQLVGQIVHSRNGDSI